MRTTQSTLQEMYQSGEKIAALTCYDACFSAVLENAGVDVLLVGDSIGNVLQGNETTLAVSLDDMCYHTRCVYAGTNKTFIMSDLPFGTYQVSPEKAFENASKLLAAGAQMVKLEGGEVMAKTIAYLTQRGIPVCAHIGLTPQSIHQLGGYKVQGKSEQASKQLLDSALVLEEAGANMLLMELVPATLAKNITDKLSIPTIGIGAGADCSAQVLVLHDMLGLYPGKKPRFVKDYMTESSTIQHAITNYIDEVKSGRFPGIEHQF